MQFRVILTECYLITYFAYTHVVLPRNMRVVVIIISAHETNEWYSCSTGRW